LAFSYPDLAIQPLMDSAVFNLGMTGTIFRSDNQRIAGIPYINNNGLVQIDFASKKNHFISYSRKDALKDKAVIHSVFQQIDGEANWLETDGTANSVDSFTENSNDCRKGVFTALRTKYAESLLDEAATHYLSSLSKHPESKMLVVSPNIALAKSHKDYLIKKSIPCEIATSNDSNAALEAINNFRYQKHARVLVTVGMAYEGLDAPSITHLALLTHIRSLPWLDQVFARTTRFNRNSSATYDDQVATIFAPNDFLINQIISDIRTEEAQFISNDSETVTTNLQPQSTNSGSDSGQIIPINSAMTDVTAVGLDENQIILSSAQILGVQDLIKSSAFEGVSVINMAKFLSTNGIDIPECEAANDPVIQKPSTTKDRCLAIRRSIEDIIRNHEYHNNIEYGTTNKILKKHFGKARHEMTESELLDVLSIVEQHCREGDTNKQSSVVK